MWRHFAFLLYIIVRLLYTVETQIENVMQVGQTQMLHVIIYIEQ